MLAIIVPYYKYTFFESTLQSLANQTNKNFKVYIGDDGSVENPTGLIEKYKNQFDFIYKKFPSNLGRISLVQHWERCLQMTEDEDWIIILGDDDVLATNYIESFYKNINCFAEEYNVIRFASCNIDEEGKQSSKVFVNPIIESSIDFFFRERRSSLSEYVFNKEKLLEKGLKDFPLAWCTDILAVLEMSDFKDVYSINDAIAYIRVSDKSISGNTKSQKLKNKAAFEFLHYLLIIKKGIFNTLQKKALLREMNSLYLNDKKNIYFFLKISIFYIKSFWFRSYLVLLKQIIMSLKSSIQSKI